jgi:hypothetical protein
MASISSFTREIQLFDQHATPPKKFDLTLNEHLHNYVVRELNIDKSFLDIANNNAQILALQTDLKDTKDTLIALGILGPNTPTGVPAKPLGLFKPLNMLYDPLGKTFEITWGRQAYILGIAITITGVTTFVPNPHVAVSYTVRLPYIYDPYVSTPKSFNVDIKFTNIIGASPVMRLAIPRFLKPLAISSITRAKLPTYLVVTIDSYDPALPIKQIAFYSFKDDPLDTTYRGSVNYYDFNGTDYPHGTAASAQEFIDDTDKMLLIVAVYSDAPGETFEPQDATEKGIGYPIPSINPPPPIY